MPVWHERTQALVKAGRLKVLGITQEQHPERCRLFCQWKGIDWPILWDPFNLTGSKAVPNFSLVDEHGVVRMRIRSETDVSEALRTFLETEYAAPQDLPAPPRTAGQPPSAAPGTPEENESRALAALLAHREEDPSPAIKVLARPESTPAKTFRLGVAYRMRHDSPFQEPGDFQRALALWHTALAARRDQYIWRRRIQQYGPKLDKPYPFYDWVDRAARDLAARKETPVRLRVELSDSERMAWASDAATKTEPDAEGIVPVAPGVASIEAAVAWDTAALVRAGRLHVEVRPTSADHAMWSSDAGPVVLWIEVAAPDGSGWHVTPNRIEAPAPPGPSDDEGSTAPVTFETEVQVPTGTNEPVTVRGYVLMPVCRKSDGACLVVRQDFEQKVRLPGAR